MKGPMAVDACKICGNEIRQAGVGRPRIWCSKTCTIIACHIRNTPADVIVSLRKDLAKIG